MNYPIEYTKTFRGHKSYLFFLFSILFFCHSIYALENHSLLEKELEKALHLHWGVDQHTTAYIGNKLKPLLENITHHSVVKDFIALSTKQNIDFSIHKKIKPLQPEDGIFKATKEHVVIFESPYVRILWGSTEPGAREDFHEHAWKSVMVIIKATTYEIEYPDGRKETIDYPAGTFELPAGERYACTNLGKMADASLRFEVKN